MCSHIDAVVLWWFALLGYVIGTFIGHFVFRSNIAGNALDPLFSSAAAVGIGKTAFFFSFAYFMQSIIPELSDYCRSISIICHTVFLVFRQPDLGSSLVYGFWVAMLLAGGLPHYTDGVAGIGALLFPGLWHVLLPYQREVLTLNRRWI